MIYRNDPQACYDRIVLWIASLAIQKIGLSKAASFYMKKIYIVGNT